MVRVFYFYGGPNYKNDLWGNFNKAIKNKKKFFEIKNKKILRDYLHINDVVKIIWKLLFFDKDLGIVNICSNKPVSVDSLVKSWIKNSKKLK